MIFETIKEKNNRLFLYYIQCKKLKSFDTHDIFDNRLNRREYRVRDRAKGLEPLINFLGRKRSYLPALAYRKNTNIQTVRLISERVS